MKHLEMSCKSVKAPKGMKKKMKHHSEMSKKHSKEDLEKAHHHMKKHGGR